MRVAPILCLVALCLGLFATSATALTHIELPPGPGRDLVYARCQTCHDLQYVVDSAGITAGNWSALIEDMGQYGLRIPADERAKIVAYLSSQLGPGGPQKVAAGPAPTPASADGAAVFARTCSACHQAQGTGLPSTFPPLAGNPDLFIDRLFPVYVVLNGLEGQLTVKGLNYNGAMPAFGHLSDGEVAAVVNYIRSGWGNDQLRPAGITDLDAKAVAQARQEALQPKAVLAYRAAHK